MAGNTRRDIPSSIGRRPEPEASGDLSIRTTPFPAAVAAIEDRTGRINRATLDRLLDGLGRALDFLGATGECRIRIVGDPEMAAAHSNHLGEPGTTDVITFNLAEAGAGSRLDADLLICLDEAARQSAAREGDLEHELLLYAVHGVLHCLGHDDHNEAGYARMHALEDEVLTALGVGAVFDPARKGAKG